MLTSATFRIDYKVLEEISKIAFGFAEEII